MKRQFHLNKNSFHIHSTDVPLDKRGKKEKCLHLMKYGCIYLIRHFMVQFYIYFQCAYFSKVCAETNLVLDKQNGCPSNSKNFKL